MPSISTRRLNQKGFTLIELLMALLLFSALLAFSTTYLTGSLNEARFLQTVERMKQVRQALLGDTLRRQGKVRSNFGYNGDIGALPAALGALSTNPSLPAWSVNAAARFALGWSGDYLGPANLGADFANDAWGTGFLYSAASTPPTLTSYGADRAAGGTGLNADLVLQMPATVRRSKVHGIIVANGAPFTGAAQVELNSANGSGGLSSTLVNVVAADKGHFVFTDVPQGVRSATVYVPTKAAATITVGPAVFTVDRPHYLINTKFFDVGTLVGPTNIEVAMEMVDYGISSNLINLFTTFERTRTPLDTNDYDGTSITYSFEIVATNSALLNSAINLVNSAGAAVGSITVPGLTNNPTRFRATFTPTAGSNDYRLQIPITLLLNQITITTGRILVSQVNATKTRIYVPLIGDTYGGFSAADNVAVDSTSSTAFTQGAPIDYSIWRKNLSRLSLATTTASPYTFVASLQGGNLGGTATAALFNRTTGLAVAGSAISKAGNGYALVQTNFSDAAANFADLSDYEVRIQSSSILQTASIARAGLYIRLEKLGRGESYYRVARSYSGTASPYFDAMRAFINPASFSNPMIANETVGFASTAGVNSFQLYDAGNNDAGTAGAVLAGSGLTLPAAKSRQRSGAFTITPGDRTLGRAVGNGAATTNLSSDTVIVQFNY
ncbi:MAG: prepilin-type N-terminal cleavage/methylation domain-containing protein [Proteobacteria bacterium]|nr:MAG: prepilin-type N-terminal cleavage/methylation domain-containing protein [Pseudomonadota bacterium]